MADEERLAPFRTKIQRTLEDLTLNRYNAIDADNKLQFFRHLLSCSCPEIVEHYFSLVEAQNYDILNLDMSNFYIDIYRFITTYDRKHQRLDRSTSDEASGPSRDLSPQPSTSSMQAHSSTRLAHNNPEVALLVGFLRDLVPSANRRGRKRKSESVSSVSLTNLDDSSPSLLSPNYVNLKPKEEPALSLEKTQADKEFEKSLQSLSQMKKKRGRPLGSKEPKDPTKEQLTKMMGKEAEDILNDLDLGDLKMPNPISMPSEMVDEGGLVSPNAGPAVSNINLANIGHTDLTFAPSLLYDNEALGSRGLAPVIEVAGEVATSVTLPNSASKNLQELTPPDRAPVNSNLPPPAMIEVLEQSLGLREYNHDPAEPLAFGNLWLPYYIEPNVFNSPEGQVLKDLSMKLEQRLEVANYDRDTERHKGLSEFTAKKKLDLME